jgi:hypothetical protein
MQFVRFCCPHPIFITVKIRCSKFVSLGLNNLAKYVFCIYMYTYNFFSRPLHVAARNGLTMVVQELLGKGASVLAVDENGK